MEKPDLFTEFLLLVLYITLYYHIYGGVIKFANKASNNDLMMKFCII